MNKKIKNLIIFFTLMLIFIPIFTGCGESEKERRERIKKKRIEKEEKKEAEERAKDLEITATYKKACRELDFLTAHEVLDKIQNQCLSIERRYGTQDEVNIIESKYFHAVDYVYGQEIIYLLYSDESNVDLRISMLLSEFPLLGLCPKEGLYDENEGRGCIDSHDKEYYEINLYFKSANSFNLACDKILDFAIENRNKELASLVIKKYKSVPYIVCKEKEISKNEWTGSTMYYTYIEYDKTSLKEAKKRYNSAF